jgi:hypothetical protein
VGLDGFTMDYVVTFTAIPGVPSTCQRISPILTPVYTRSSFKKP